MSRLRLTWSLFVFAFLTGCSIAPSNHTQLLAQLSHPEQPTPVPTTSVPVQGQGSGTGKTGSSPATSATSVASQTGSSPATPPAMSSTPPVPSYPLLTLGTHSTSVLRLQQLLADLHYLPLSFQISKPSATPTPATSVPTPSTDLQPQQGTWSWSYPHIPRTLRQIWIPDTYTVLTEGAIMSFERNHGIAVDGVAGPQVWRTLLQAATAYQVDPHGYSYVLVTKSQPERLVLWYQGQDVYSFPANTGIAQSPTPNGTWPVYLRFTSQTMSGQNPNGTHYSDPGVPWVNYFYQGDAVHGFIRSSYGYAQSLGCVELPVPDAQDVWNYIHYGTLVTVH